MDNLPCNCIVFLYANVKHGCEIYFYLFYFIIGFEHLYIYDFLKYRAKVEGFATAKRDNISPYLRNTLLTMINEGRYEVVETSGISRELLIELTRIGINLNQAMHAMHSYGSENELINLAKNVELTRKVLLKITNAITAPQKLPVATQGSAA